MANPFDLDLKWIVESDVWDRVCPLSSNTKAPEQDVIAKAKYLSYHLGRWAVDAGFALRFESMKQTRGFRGGLPEASGDRLNQSLLNSMSLAVEKISQTYRLGVVVYIPVSFLEVAKQIATNLSSSGTDTNHLNASNILLKLSFFAKEPMCPQAVHVDPGGVVTDSAGGKLPEFDPMTVRRGLQEMILGQIVSLDDLQKADRRDGW